MKTYMLVIEGAGEGCDYTLGCNMTTMKIKAGNVEEARAIARKEYPGPDCYIPWEYVTLVEVIESLPVSKWAKEEQRKEELRREANKTAADRAEYERLKAQFGGGE